MSLLHLLLPEVSSSVLKFTRKKGKHIQGASVANVRMTGPGNVYICCGVAPSIRVPLFTATYVLYNT